MSGQPVLFDVRRYGEDNNAGSRLMTGITVRHKRMENRLGHPMAAMPRFSNAREVARPHAPMTGFRE